MIIKILHNGHLYLYFIPWQIKEKKDKTIFNKDNVTKL